MLVNVDGLPGVVDPGVAEGAGGEVASGVEHLGGELALLLLVLVLEGLSAKTFGHGGERARG